MGKIRIKTLGDEEKEKEQKKKLEKKKEAKQAKGVSLKEQSEPKGDSLSENETEAQKLSDSTIARETSKETSLALEAKQVKKTKKEKFTKKGKKLHSKKYQSAAKIIDKNKVYSLNEALEILPKLKLSKFDETVELHVNTIEQGLSGKTKLPHGTGKEVKVAIADPSTGSGQVDALLKKIESGVIDFDVLLATPDVMPKLAKVAKILGPRGLMPNPKNGTISQDPEKESEKFKGGNISFKTETKASIIHLSVGKISFGDKKLMENIKAVISAITLAKIKNVTLKSTMSPGIKIDFTKTT